MTGTIIKASTSKGKQLLASFNQNIGYTLDDIYEHYSSQKAYAYKQIIHEYENDVYSYEFRMCGKNSCFFTCGYYTMIADEDVAIFHTAYNKYIIYLNK